MTLGVPGIPRIPFLGGGDDEPITVGSDDRIEDLHPAVVAAINERLLNFDGVTVTTLDGKVVDPFTATVTTDTETIALVTHIQRQFGADAAFAVASAGTTEATETTTTGITVASTAGEVDEDDLGEEPEPPPQGTIFPLGAPRLFLGVHNDFQAVTIFDPQTFGLPGPPSSTFITPRYAPGNEVDFFTGLSVEQIALIQDRMIEAGVLDANSIRAGIWDINVDAVAMAGIMGQANFDGITFSEEIDRLRDTPLPELEELKRQPFVRPNRAEAEFNISKEFEARLHRKPTKAELDDLADFQEMRLRMSHEAAQDERLLVDGEDADGNRVRQLDARFGSEQLDIRERARGVDITEVEEELLESPQSAFGRFFDSRFGATISRNIQGDKDLRQARGLSDQLRFLRNTT